LAEQLASKSPLIIPSDPQSSSWQEKIYSGFFVIKYIVFAMLVVEAAVAFIIILRLRIAWAVMLNRFGGECHD
jgi:hypothetical protein